MDVFPIDELSESQVDELHQLYQALWWSRGRSREGVLAMLSGSLAVGFEDAGGRLAGFARVITDGIYKALILDVVVAPRYRGRGLGRALVDRILEHPELSGVAHFELYCEPSMTEFYEKWGFADVGGAVTFMRRSAG